MNKKRIIYVSLAAVASVLIVAAIIIVIWRVNASDSKYPKPVPINQEIYYPVTRVLDGDTFNLEIDKKEITVRMLGINTPETVDPRKLPECFGKEASDETKLLIGHQSLQIRLNPKREVRDKYGRYLAYIYREDGLFVNEYLLKNGFAREYTYGKPYSMQRLFMRFEKEAQKEGRGLWAKCVEK